MFDNFYFIGEPAAKMFIKEVETEGIKDKSVEKIRLLLENSHEKQRHDILSELNKLCTPKGFAKIGVNIPMLEHLGGIANSIVNNPDLYFRKMRRPYTSKSIIKKIMFDHVRKTDGNFRYENKGNLDLQEGADKALSMITRMINDFTDFDEAIEATEAVILEHTIMSLEPNAPNYARPLAHISVGILNGAEATPSDNMREHLGPEYFEDKKYTFKNGFVVEMGSDESVDSNNSFAKTMQVF